jgi:hypothetical protein
MRHLLQLRTQWSVATISANGAKRTTWAALRNRRIYSSTAARCAHPSATAPRNRKAEMGKRSSSSPAPRTPARRVQASHAATPPLAQVVSGLLHASIRNGTTSAQLHAWHLHRNS